MKSARTREDSASPARRGRGRPRKSAASPAREAEPSVSPSRASPSPAKRGRPPKSAASPARAKVQLQAEATAAEAKRQKVAKIATIVVFYMLISLSLVFLNKFIMVLENIRFERPLLITWYQLVVAFIAIAVLGTTGVYGRPLELRWDRVKTCLPLGMLYVAMLTANNLCLMYVEVSFYQVVRNLNIVFQIVLLRLLESKYPSRRVVAACTVVVAGYLIASLGELRFSWLGVFWGLLSSVLLALYGHGVKRTMRALENDDCLLQIYNTAIAVVLLGPITYFMGDFTVLRESGFLYDRTFWQYMTGAALVGYLINIATFLQIKHTSPLTHTIAGTAKGMIQTALGAAIFQNPISPLNAVGIVTCLGGSSWYACIRYQEGIVAQAPTPAAPRPRGRPPKKAA